MSECGPAAPWVMREAVARYTGAGLAQVQDLGFDDLEELWRAVWEEDEALAREVLDEYESRGGLGGRGGAAENPHGTARG